MDNVCGCVLSRQARDTLIVNDRKYSVDINIDNMYYRLFVLFDFCLYLNKLGFLLDI